MATLRKQAAERLPFVRDAPTRWLIAPVAESTI